jgi:hypothetical protein
VAVGLHQHQWQTSGQLADLMKVARIFAGAPVLAGPFESNPADLIIILPGGGKNVERLALCATQFGSLGGTKRPAPGQYHEGFQQAGFTGPVGPHDEIQPGMRSNADPGEIPQIFNSKFCNYQMRSSGD